jgi:hypothetical protein
MCFHYSFRQFSALPIVLEVCKRNDQNEPEPLRHDQHIVTFTRPCLFICNSIDYKYYKFRSNKW